MTQSDLENQDYYFDNPLTFQDLIDAGFDKESLCDSATWTLIQDWFKYRRVQEHFDNYFSRVLSIKYKQYFQMLRIDPIMAKYDWFVEHYREHEHQVLGSSTLTIEGSDSGSVTGTSTNASTTETSGTSSGSNSSTETGSTTTSGSSTSKTDSEKSGANRNMGYAKAAPMSSSYTSADLQDNNSITLTAGDNSVTDTSVGHGIPNPMMYSPSSSTDALAKAHELAQDSNSSTSSNTGTSTDTISGTTTGTTAGTSETNSTGSTAQSTESERSETHTGETNTLTREIVTGRNNKISEMIDEAVRTIQTTSAWDYLYTELDKCFMQAY